MKHKCPDCLLPLIDEPENKRYVCPKCGKALVYPSEQPRIPNVTRPLGPEPVEAPPIKELPAITMDPENSRRIVRISLSEELMRSFTVEKEHPTNMVTVVKGVPKSARLVATTFDAERLWVNLFFEHESYGLVPEGGTIPVLQLGLSHEPVFPIPMEYLEMLLHDLERSFWDTDNSPISARCPAAWVLLNKIKKVVGLPIEERASVSWDDLKKHLEG